MVKMAGVNFSDIEDAFLFVGSAPYGANSAYLNLETGEIFYQSEMADITDLGDEEKDWDHIIEIPHKKDLALGQSLVFEFVKVNLPDAYDQVRHMFRRKGAYSHFKEFLVSNDLFETWYRFEHEREQKALRCWCEKNQISLLDKSGEESKTSSHATEE
jgi:Uncharacterised protein family (UPF0158)